MNVSSRAYTSDAFKFKHPNEHEEMERAHGSFQRPIGKVSVKHKKIQGDMPERPKIRKVKENCDETKKRPTA